jgi:hypothetical protein
MIDFTGLSYSKLSDIRRRARETHTGRAIDDRSDDALAQAQADRLTLLEEVDRLKGNPIECDPGDVDEHTFDASCACREPLPEYEFMAKCPACGDFMDGCPGHPKTRDPVGFAILAKHEKGDHSDCDPAGCDEAPNVPS